MTPPAQFARQTIRLQFPKDIHWGDDMTVWIAKTGDIARTMYLRVTWPTDASPFVQPSAGTAMIDRVELSYKDQLIERIYGENLYMLGDTRVPQAKQTALSTMVGTSTTSNLASYHIPMPFSILDKGLPLIALDEAPKFRVIFKPSSFFTTSTSPNVFPPSGMTSAATQNGNQFTQALTEYAFGGTGNYIASSSTFYPSGIEQPWRMFDKNNNGTWWTTSSGSYSTITGLYTAGVYSTTISGSPYAGEWIQIRLPSAIILYSYTLYNASSWNSRAPVDFKIAGSNDGTNWTIVDTQTGITSWTSSTTNLTFTPSNTSTAYSYYRLCVNKYGQGNGGFLSMGEWVLNGSIYYNPMYIKPIQVDLFVEYVYVTQAERDYLTSHELIYTTESFQRLQFRVPPLTTQSSVQFLTSFVNDVKELYWVIQRDDASNVYDYGTTDQLVNLQLTLNSIDRITPDYATAQYLRVIQGLQFHTRIPNGRYYMYSFALEPELNEPSGEINMTNITRQQHTLTLTPSTSARSVRLYALSYNLFSVSKGNGVSLHTLQEG